jgi:tryptophan halogenase
MKIVIVGGGTAGWISAAMVLKYRNDVEVTVVESSKIPIIGAGEGSADSLRWFINEHWPNNMVNEIDFLKKTKGTLKLAINLKNWKGDGSYMYSPLYTTPTTRAPIDRVFLSSILKYGKSDMGSINSWILEDNLSTYNKNHKPPMLPNSGQDICGHAYHFDGHEVGKYFKNICLQLGAKCVDSEVIDTNFDGDEYLKSIRLNNGLILEADMFFDCSGFSRILMSKTSNKWISYKDYLPVNSAIPFSTQILSRTVRFETLAETMDSGWMWKIPLQDRHGCGYVYCDAFQSYDKSIEELEKKLGHSVEPIKHIQFDSGRYENIWHKNIVAIGLSSHFLEPLQATSIHVSIYSASNLILHSLKSIDTIKNETIRERYNQRLRLVVDDYKDLLQMHYLAGRNDTPFWKFVRNEMKITERNKELLEISKHRLINNYDVDESYGIAGWTVWSHILDNAAMFKKEIIEKELKSFNKFFDGADDLKRLEDFYKNKVKPGLASAEQMFKYFKL